MIAEYEADKPGREADTDEVGRPINLNCKGTEIYSRTREKSTNQEGGREKGFDS
jgi:hypothetical protein